MRHLSLVASFIVLFLAAFWLYPQPAPAQSGTIPPHAYYTLPADFPKITVTVPANGTDAGYLFIAPFQFTACPKSWLLILDNQAEPIYYQRLPECENGLDWKKQPNGQLTYMANDQRIFFALDDTYTQVATYQAGNGYPTDIHELQILENGNALLMIYDFEIIDNRGIAPNGRPTVTVEALVIQELDPAGRVLLQWHSLHYLPVTDSEDRYLNGREPIDYAHGNSIEEDIDGNLLISSRHLNEITKIDRHTGAIIWRLGGKGNRASVDLSQGG